MYRRFPEWSPQRHMLMAPTLTLTLTLTLALTLALALALTLTLTLTLTRHMFMDAPQRQAVRDLPGSAAPATLCDPGCNPMPSGLQPYACALQVRDLLGLASTFDGGVAILPKLYCHIDRYWGFLLRGVRVRVSPTPSPSPSPSPSPTPSPSPNQDELPPPPPPPTLRRRGRRG